MFYEAKAGRAELVLGVLGLVIVEATVNYILFCLRNQALLYFMGSAVHPTLDYVCKEGLMMTNMVAAVAPQ